MFLRVLPKCLVSTDGHRALTIPSETVPVLDHSHSKYIFLNVQSEPFLCAIAECPVSSDQGE